MHETPHTYPSFSGAKARRHEENPATRNTKFPSFATEGPASKVRPKDSPAMRENETARERRWDSALTRPNEEEDWGVERRKGIRVWRRRRAAGPQLALRETA